MNYNRRIHYKIYTTQKDTFTTMVDILINRIDANDVILRLVFLGISADNKEYTAQRSIIYEKIKKRFAGKIPALSYVAEPPLDGGLTLEVHSYTPDKNDNISYKSNNGYYYVVLQNEYARFLFAGGFQSDVINYSIEKQSHKVFPLIDDILKLEQFPINSIIRQWNYIERITDFEGDNQNYQSFNNARNDYYAKAEWDKGYPAATGIGAEAGGILIDLDAVVFKSPACYATPIDNKLQIAAHRYSDQVLLSAQDKKMTPKFERAKCMTFADNRLIYISGTAAIRGEESLKGVGLEHQLHITMDNIAQLTGNTNLIMLRVYLKEKSFMEETKRLLDEYKLNIPISYLKADVCRSELLIEIEGISTN